MLPTPGGHLSGWLGCPAEETVEGAWVAGSSSNDEQQMECREGVALEDSGKSVWQAAATRTTACLPACPIV